MSSLSKLYRIIWDEDNILISDPYTQYSIGSITYTNASLCFESDYVDDITNKINELGLIYINPEENTEITEEDI